MTTLLIGCGYWGKNWANTLFGLNELGAICEADTARHGELKANYPGVTLYGNLSEALAHNGLEAAIVATPVPTHPAVARQVLESDLSVLVEKPLTLTAVDAEDLVKLANARGKVLAVGHILMYHPAVIKLKELVDSGELGNILGVECSRTNLGKVRNEENAWWSLAPHDISVISMLLGEDFTVTAAGGLRYLGRPGLEDAVDATFESGSGRFARIHVSWLSPEKRRETVVIGDKKIAVFNDALPDNKLTVLDYSLDRAGDTVNGIQSGGLTPVAFDEAAKPLTLEFEHFIRAVREGGPLVNDGHNGLLVVRNLEDVHNRLEARRPVVV